jgi:hypothetical protein
MYQIINKSHHQNKEYFIMDKNSSEYFTQQHLIALSGPMQSCEDSICSKCSVHKGTNYMECKKKCFTEKATDINDCCKSSCSSIKGLLGKSECLQACNPMAYYMARWS